MIKAKDYILGIEPYKPGKSKTGNERKVIKLSSNENALGASGKAIKAFEESSPELFRYPDGGCILLREAIAKKYQIETDNIVCGAGSDEIIALLIHAFCGEGDEVLYSEYGFLMYPISAKRVGATPITAKEVNLKANVDNILAKVSQKTKMIFIANPNNPTGSYLSASEIERLIQNISRDIILVLDLAYAEFVSEADYADVIQLVKKYDNLVMTRTFSKIHGLASLRLGWSYSSAYIADVLNRARGPFNVSAAAQKAGIAAINDDEFVKKSKEHNDKWLKILAEKFDEIGLKHYPSIANFILIDFLSEEKCQEANQFLTENGIILRDMKAYNLPSCLRMTVGREEENLLVVNLLTDFLQK